jgi:hypothetical protein
LPSDNHKFVGRIYDLSIVGMHFETYEELAKHADCDVNYALSMLTRRVESHDWRHAVAGGHIEELQGVSRFPLRMAHRIG